MSGAPYLRRGSRRVHASKMGALSFTLKRLLNLQTRATEQLIRNFIPGARNKQFLFPDLSNLQGIAAVLTLLGMLVSGIMG